MTTYGAGHGAGASYRDEVLTYFSEKADAYDLVDEQVYWRLSDTLLWESLTEALPGERSAFRFLDAGGGTGRWSQRILDAYPLASGVIYDLSEAMLEQARDKFEARATDARITLQLGDLTELTPEHGRFDVIICLHNVAGFVADFTRCLNNFARCLKPGGIVAVLAPNRYHVAWFNLLRQDFELAEQALSSGIGRFTTDMPAMRLFSPSELVDMAEATGLQVLRLTGFPVVVYPGFQETRRIGNSPAVTDTLGSQANLEKVIDLERRLLREPDLAARGNNLLLIGRSAAHDH